MKKIIAVLMMTIGIGNLFANSIEKQTTILITQRLTNHLQKLI